MAKRQLTPEFREFLACLNRANVDYLVVGGYAVNHYGLEFWQAYARRVEARIDGEPVKLISLADLKINKRASGRNKDLADLDNLP